VTYTAGGRARSRRGRACLASAAVRPAGDRPCASRCRPVRRVHGLLGTPRAGHREPGRRVLHAAPGRPSRRGLPLWRKTATGGGPGSWARRPCCTPSGRRPFGQRRWSGWRSPSAAGSRRGDASERRSDRHGQCVVSRPGGDPPAPRDGSHTLVLATRRRAACRRSRAETTGPRVSFQAGRETFDFDVRWSGPSRPTGRDSALAIAMDVRVPAVDRTRVARDSARPLRPGSTTSPAAWPGRRRHVDGHVRLATGALSTVLSKDGPEATARPCDLPPPRREDAGGLLLR